MPISRRRACSLILASMSAVLISGAASGAAFAESATAAPGSAATADLFVLDTSYGDAQSLLYFQVGGMGFQSGEVVVIRASVLVGQDGGDAVALAPVQVTANRYGEIAATLVGSGPATAGSGYLIRAVGPRHHASVIDLIDSAASITSAGTPISFVR